MRRDSEVPLEVENGIYMPGGRNVTHLALEFGCRKGNKGIMRTMCSSVVISLSTCFALFFFRFGSSSVIYYSFLALPPQYHHQCLYTPFKTFPNGIAESPVVPTLPPIVGINCGNSFASTAVLQTWRMLRLMLCAWIDWFWRFMKMVSAI